MKVLQKIDYFLLGLAALFGLAAASVRFDDSGAGIFPILFLALSFITAAAPLLKLLGRLNEKARAEKILVGVIFAVHLISTLFFFPPEEIVNDLPVLTLDHSVHYYQAARAKEVFWRDFRLDTYDPYFMAGYPGGTVFDIDSKGMELWTCLLPFIDTARAYKLFILLAHLLLVFTLYSGCRRLLFDFEESIYALLLFLAFWHWGRPYAGDFRFAGMFSFLFVSHLSLYIAGLFRKFLNEERSVFFYIVGPLAFLIHPTAAVILPIPFIALFLAQRRLSIPGRKDREWEIRILFRLVLWCLIIILVNLVWLIPFFRYLDIKTPSEAFFQIKGVTGLGRLLLKAGNLPALLLMALAIAGGAGMIARKECVKAAAPLSGSIFLLCIAGFGVYIPLFDQMEPGRFLLTSFVFLAPLAGSGLSMTVKGFLKLVRKLDLAVSFRTAVIMTLIACIPFFSLIESREYYKHTLSTKLPPEIDDMMKALRNHIHPSGRLMIENCNSAVYYYNYLPAVIPLYTGVEQIGGPYPFAFIKHNFTSFGTEELFGSTIREIGQERMNEYIKLYNVRWVLTVTPYCSKYFSSFPHVFPIWSSGLFTLWEVSAASAAEKESGRKVGADYGCIFVNFDAGISPPESILLPYHFDRGLKVAPPARISGRLCLDDPVPFILLEPGGKREIEIIYR
ncbi:MAG: hypothetical protein JW746_05460 [Candidatus Krumholzibacteriota bacterium]|nr:hypothetical protein [Candidatus Krumholzibacteriota bacterium]